MQDRQLYEQILGIASPWFVDRVELKLEEGAVRVHLDHCQGAAWPCAECGRECPLYDHVPERTWRHLDTCQYQTLLTAATPRTDCPEHGVRAVRLPWAEPHSRFTLLFVTDLDGSRVLYVAADRKQSSLDGFWRTLSAEQLAAIEGVAIDMWEPYENSIRRHLPQAERKIVFDKFHVARNLGEAVDRVRRQENQALRAAGDDRLVGTKYDWLRNPDNFGDEQWRGFRELRTSKLRTARAWAMREQAMLLWDYRYEGPARKHFAWWYRWATHSRLKPMIEKAKMLKSRLANILTYLKKPITNAVSESLNSKIQWIKYTARGYRNFENFMTAIYFHCGGLQLNPSPT